MLSQESKESMGEHGMLPRIAHSASQGNSDYGFYSTKQGNLGSRMKPLSSTIWLDSSNVDALNDPRGQLNGDGAIGMSLRDAVWSNCSRLQLVWFVHQFQYFLAWLVINAMSLGVGSNQPLIDEFLTAFLQLLEIRD